MVGLPDAGKTTFLAAFWHVLRTDEVPGALRLADVLTGDRAYLNKIALQWTRCEKPDRTSTKGVPVVMRVIESGTGRDTKLSIPDLSGESYEEQWEKRECSSEFARLAGDANGVLLFIHPDLVKETDSIAAANLALQAWGGDTAPAAGAEEEKPTPWSARGVPTQVKLVALLQFMWLHARRSLRVAVIVSAWDMVKPPQEPATWLAKRLPLLAQYLDANTESIENRVYGVSAQGAPLSSALTTCWPREWLLKGLRSSGLTPPHTTLPPQ